MWLGVGYIIYLVVLKCHIKWYKFGGKNSLSGTLGARHEQELCEGY